MYYLKKMCALSHKNLLSYYHYQETDDNISKIFNERTEEVCETLDCFINGNQQIKLTIRGYQPLNDCLWDFGLFFNACNIM